METRTTTPITTVMVLLEEKLRQQVRQDKPLLVAIDGRCASGKSTLAKDLQKQLDCNVIHMDDFYLQPHPVYYTHLDVYKRQAGWKMDRSVAELWQRAD